MNQSDNQEAFRSHFGELNSKAYGRAQTDNESNTRNAHESMFGTLADAFSVSSFRCTLGKGRMHEHIVNVSVAA